MLTYLFPFILSMVLMLVIFAIVIFTPGLVKLAIFRFRQFRHRSVEGQQMLEQAKALRKRQVPPEE